MCPPGTDQTERGPQQWHFIVPTKRSKLPLKSRRNKHPILGPVSIDDIRIWPKVYHNPTGGTWTASTVPVKPNVSTIQTSSILLLPLELQSEILSYLPKSTLTALALTCTSFHHQVANIIVSQVAVADSHLSWAGQPILCVGNYLTDLPSSFMHDDLAFKSINRDDMVGIDMYAGRRGGKGMVPARIFNYGTCNNYTDVLEEESDQAAWIAEIQAVQNQSNDVPAYVIARLLKAAKGGPDPGQVCADSQLTGTTVSNGDSDTKVFYLRNLTKKIYAKVCCCAELGWHLILPPNLSTTLEQEPPQARNPEVQVYGNEGRPIRSDVKECLQEDHVGPAGAKANAAESPRGDPADKAKAKANVVQMVNLDSVLVLLLQWGKHEFGQALKGAWAGDSIDIISKGAHDLTRELGDWTDESLGIFMEVIKAVDLPKQLQREFYEMMMARRKNIF